MKTDQEPEYPLRARVVKMVDSQNHRGGDGEPFGLRHYLIVADDPHSAYDHLITVFPSDHPPMLIAFCLLYLTYSPWPVAGAIWTRSARRKPDTDELREFEGSAYGCKPNVFAVVLHVLGYRRVTFAIPLGSRESGL